MRLNKTFKDCVILEKGPLRLQANTPFHTPRVCSASGNGAHVLVPGPEKLVHRVDEDKWRHEVGRNRGNCPSSHVPVREQRRRRSPHGEDECRHEAGHNRGNCPSSHVPIRERRGRHGAIGAPYLVGESSGWG